MKSQQWFLFAIALFLNTNIFAQTYCFENDSLAVRRLYDGLGVSYSLATPVSSWTGITSTIPDTIFPLIFYRIENIDLTAAGLIGIIRDSIFEGDSLAYLQELNLSSNPGITGIAGKLRYDNIGSPQALHTIDISNCGSLNAASLQFFEYFFSNLGNLSFFYANRGLININPILSQYVFPFNGIQGLFLDENGFSGTLELDSLKFYMPSLNTLSMSKNFLLRVNSSIGLELEYLYISDNDLQYFSDIIAVINNNGPLKEFGANSAMGAADTLVASLLHHLSLNILDLGYNNLRGPIPLDFFEKLDSIKVLVLQHNQLTGELPVPSGIMAGGPFDNQLYYSGLGRIESLNLKNNYLTGTIPLHWIYAAQFSLYNTADMPATELFFADNYFESITPELLNVGFYQLVNSPTYSGRFDNLQYVTVENNQLDFIDLYRIKEFLRFQQSNFGGDDHYFPQLALDSMGFAYNYQANAGIGGVKRRATGTEVIFDGEVAIAEPIASGGNYYISNNYFWERLDTVGILGGTPGAPVTQFIGQVYQNGASTTLDLNISHGLSGTDTTYHLGVDMTAANAHNLWVLPLDSLQHARWDYQVKITNDSFPLLDLYTNGKRLEVGPCIDASGQPVHCQSMMVQFKPSQFAGLTLMQQDSVKEALRISLGAKPIESCLCGDIELWEISDTASAMLEGNGSGTKNATTTTSTKPQLLSADPNYDLLGGTSNSIPVSAAPAGSGNSTAKTLVAIIDSGLDFGYTPLRSHLSEGLPMDTSCINNAVWGYNFLNKNNDASDDHGHGTAVASIVAGINQNNLLPNTGVYAGKLAILPLKYTDKKGKGSLFHAACALRYAADFQRLLPNGDTAQVRVINASWGFSGDPSPLIDNTLKYAGMNCDILVICSAGNDGHIIHGVDSLRHWPSNSIFDPADTIATDNVLGVGAIPTHGSDVLTTYSNFSNKHVDLVAQGNDSTAKAGSVNGFVWQEGTSFSAPQVARAAGLLFDKYPDASYFAVKYALMTGSDKLQSLDSTKVKSKGRLNYIKADSILNIITNKSLCAENAFTINVSKIDGNNNEDLVNLYPNPVSNELNLDFDAKLLDKEISLTVFNAQGQSLYHAQLERGAGHYVLSTKNLPTGIYFLQLNTENQQINKRFLKR